MPSELFRPEVNTFLTNGKLYDGPGICYNETRYDHVERSRNCEFMDDVEKRVQAGVGLV